MPTRVEAIQAVANQMIKGPRPGRLPGTAKQRELFKKRHKIHIAWAIDELPRCSAATAAVVVKCLIKYDNKKVAEFCRSLKNNLFQGVNDPVFLLWKFIQNHRGRDTTIPYQKTVAAARAYMEDKQVKALRLGVLDIFDWDEGWTVPDEYLANWKPDETPTRKEEVLV